MPSTVDLAARLQQLPDATLDQVVSVRGVPQHVASYLDLAEHLLTSASVEAALETASPQELVDAAAGRSSARMDDVGLGIDGDAFGEVQRQAMAFEQGAAPDAVEPEPDAIAAERAVEAATVADELLRVVAGQPVRLRTRGELSMVDARRLAEATHADVDTVLGLTELLEAAGLVTRRDGELLATLGLDAWAAQTTPQRWSTIALGWLAALPEHERRIAIEVPEAWPVASVAPLAGDAVATRLEHVRSLAHRLGLQGGAPTDLASGDAAALSALLPEPIAHAYVQPDLSIVVPGPLSTDVERRLRTIADAERRGLASSYRLSHASLSRALAGDETEASISAFLETLSLTGVPQPVAYLVHDAATRFGTLRVHELAPVAGDGGARTAIRSDDQAMLSQLEVDRSVSAFGLQRTGPHRLVSRVSADVVLAGLTEQRYPAVLEDAEGAIRQPPTRVAPPAPTSLSPLVQRLRGSGFDVGAGERAWLERRLSLAARDRVTVQVRVSVGAEERELALLPLGVANGRLRARDTASDVERTLPIAAITHVAGAP